MSSDRDQFYSRPALPPEDDDGELELEKPDPEIEERRRKALAEARRPTIDINEVYHEAERKRSTEIVENWIRSFKLQSFQFQVKHLLVLTAVVAILLTIVKLHLWTTVIVLVMIGVAALSFYLMMEDRKQQAEADRKRQELYAARRAKFGPPTSEHVVGGPVTEPVEPMPPLPNRVDEIWQEAATKDKFKLQFSLKQLIITMTVAAFVLGLGQIFGGAEVMATILGLVALTGLVIYAAGYEPPQAVVFGWWLTLILYIAVSLFAAVWGRLA